MYRSRFSNPKRSTSGMTILEVMVVIAIIGILSAIAAPGWVSFANRQRANRATDQILQAIRSAQADARRTRRSREVTFEMVPTAADPDTLIPAVNGIRLGEGDLKAVALEVLDEDGTVILNTENDTDITNVQSVTFESTGGLDDNLDLPVYITVGVPDLDGAKKCVIIRSLLGATQTARDGECTPPTAPTS
ncbi:MAG: prepilin-type N-terminal cleavage/methylation domain-containing protein [Leptolyngbyaceae cyanobacterium]